MSIIGVQIEGVDSNELTTLRDQLLTAGATVEEKDPLTLGSPVASEIIIALGSAGVVSAVASVLLAIINRHRDCVVRIIQSGDSIELTGMSAKDVERVLSAMGRK